MNTFYQNIIMIYLVIHMHLVYIKFNGSLEKKEQSMSRSPLKELKN
jgi:hypothetical protein